MSKKKIARIAGLIYLVVVITGIFSLAYVPKQLFAYDNAELTFNNITNNETLFRLGIASSVICYIAFVLLPVALHQLLKPVNEVISKLMMVLAISSVPISLYNLSNKYAILSLISSTKQEPIEKMSELHQQTMMYLNQYDNGIFTATILWGLWLLPLGCLVFKSGFLPRILGVFLMLGSLCYVINFFGNSLSGNYASLGISKYLRFPPAVAEIGTCFWLLVIGIKAKTDVT